MCCICGTDVVVGYSNCKRGGELVKFYEEDFTIIMSAKGREFCMKAAYLSDGEFSLLKRQTLIAEVRSAQLEMKKYVAASSTLDSIIPPNLTAICLGYVW